MDNPLTKQIEEITGKVIGDARYRGKQVVLLEDAVAALEQLEKEIWSLCKLEIRRVQTQESSAFH